MTRNELFQFITENNLKKEVKAACGRPYNSVATEELSKFVENYKKQLEVQETPNFTRDECFSIIKAQHYEADIKALYGKPYNSVSTDKLNEFIKKNKQVEQEIREMKQNGCDTKIIEKSGTHSNCVDTVARQCLKAVCQILNLPELSKRLD